MCASVAASAPPAAATVAALRIGIPGSLRAALCQDPWLAAMLRRRCCRCGQSRSCGSRRVRTRLSSRCDEPLHKGQGPHNAQPSCDRVPWGGATLLLQPAPPFPCAAVPVQGGAVVFAGRRLLFAHYDEATSAHVDFEALLAAATQEL